jgi:hypothetical protein
MDTIDRKNRTLGLDVTVSGVPANLAALVEAYTEQAVYELFVRQAVYNNWNPEFRAAFVEALEEETGIARNTKGTGKFKEIKDEATGEVRKEEVTVYSESEQEYFDRVLNGADPSTYQDLADRVAKSVKFDASLRERKSAGPKALAKMYLNGAQQLIDAGAAQSAAEKLSNALGISVEPTLEGLAQALKIREDRRRQEGLKELLG